MTFIETLAENGITAGCGGGDYCPADPVTRAQMAVFLERGMNGSGFSPPPATGNTFLDVGASDFAAAFIEQLFLDGITSGCGGNNYCPNDQVTRAQMAVFLLRAKHGAGYTPPAATGVFGDVDLAYWAVAWIEQLAAEGITAGCGGGNYCPENPGSQPIYRDATSHRTVGASHDGRANQIADLQIGRPALHCLPDRATADRPSRHWTEGP